MSLRRSFWLNLPIGGFTLAVILLFFKNPPNQEISDESLSSKLKQLNIPSLAIFTGSVVCLLLALQWGGTTYSWGSGRVAAPLAAAGALFAAFLAYEIFRKDTATIPRAVILNRTAALCLLYAFCASAAFNVIDYFVRPSVA